ncbi:uncharacterized protein LOC122276102 isoform X1 [Carya illinoinensis]|uniref:Uncharacterized protein n=1 Tax=Carya illinoinensis TaxID=32201 RepID=A0A8T1RP54_CARIL|nr:uncharacterized protein LOC122276102 isoform X1 [Carya illinoinensis]KAG6668489.1 hypothetical protein CIPAW_01G174000 [Carya illinoinensis]
MNSLRRLPAAAPKPAAPPHPAAATDPAAAPDPAARTLSVVSQLQHRRSSSHRTRRNSLRRLPAAAPNGNATPSFRSTGEPPNTGMDPSTHHDAYFTNLLNNNDFLMGVTNEQEISPPQVEVIEAEPSGRKIQRGNNFNNEEDLLLVEGWLETSLDAVQEKDQKHTMLWKRIHKYFEENKKFDSLRNYTSLMNR